jgi:DNA gyrase subunit A
LADSADPARVRDVDVSEQMQQAYIDYAMSVITARALPDVRDGLLPVQRRILYAMFAAGNTAERAFRKSAKTVGDVIGNYHPHGEVSVYDSLVRLAQDFSMRYPLIEGHGNFGSIDGDPPAAMRYTEARLSRLSGELLRELDKNTVDFGPNYDDQTTEPLVLPARFPNLLVNGATGIAVGMSTNIPPHNLGEVVAATVALLEQPDLPPADLLRHVRGPDFPTGGMILGLEGIRQAYATGHGSITVRGRAEISVGRGGRQQILITEIPYQTKKSAIIERIAELYREKRLEGITSVTDGSDRHGLRIIVDLQRGANAHVVLNKLYKDTPLQQTFSIRLLALVGGRPRTLPLRELLQYYIQHQRDVVRRRTQFDLDRAERRAHIVQGLLVALDHLDEVIALIRSSPSRPEASAGLQSRFGLTEVQAEAILDMRLAQLTGLERTRLEEEFRELQTTIAGLREILASDTRLLEVIRTELQEIAARHSDQRRTQIVAGEAEDFAPEDLIQEERVVVTLTRAGYCKRTALDTYRNQGRGGRGIAAVSPREEDFVTDLFTASTHDHVLFFTAGGRVFHIRVYEIPEGARTARGTAVVNLLPLGETEQVTAMIPVTAAELLAAMEAAAEHSSTEADDAEADDTGAEEAPSEPMQPEDRTAHFLLMATAAGRVKRLRLSQIGNVRKNGIIAMGLHPGDRLIAVRLCAAADEVLLVTRNGQAARFPALEVRAMGRNARGVAGMRLAPGDEVIGMEVARPAGHLLLVTEKGMGKRTPVDEFPSHHRGSGGVHAQRLDSRTGRLVGVRLVLPDQEVMLITAQGRLIRQRVDGIPLLSRSARGVAVMRPEAGDSVASLASVAADGDAAAPAPAPTD